MDCDTFEATLTVEHSLVRDVLRAILLSILFHRTYTAVVPANIDVLDITFSIPKDPSIEKIVTDRVEAFYKSIASERTVKGQCSLIFSEKIPKKTWFGKGEDDIPWEKWILTLDVRSGTTERERNQISALTTTHLQTLLLRLIDFVTSKRLGAHIPLKAEILPGEEVGRPWRIEIGGEVGVVGTHGTREGSGGIKKMGPGMGEWEWEKGRKYVSSVRLQQPYPLI
ncbi:hypothetical protein BDY24DRAFT_439096 [Mrakia frigida]|uniref:autophagy-related protein 101 n=1 Tax=Mrakia frigida TaxID=29902 RepID=UPI003FCC0107